MKIFKWQHYLLIFGFMHFALASYADSLDEKPSENVVSARSGMGFAAGYTSGVGIAYRKHFDSEWGYQVAGIGYGDKEDIFVNVGLQSLYDLRRTELLHFYLVGGIGWFYGADNLDNVWTHSNYFGIGAGIGIEMLLMEKNLGLSLELPLTVRFEKADSLEFVGIYPIPSIALIYYF